MITIEQLLESVDLDFEPRWVTKDGDEDVVIHKGRPTVDIESEFWDSGFKRKTIGPIKLAEFENKPWQECIYEVPRKTTEKIEKIDMPDILPIDSLADICLVINEIIKKQNELVDAVNELKGTKNE